MNKENTMKTLYVSDLDGTLLRSDEKTSNYTNQTINALVEKGMIFSYATARSYVTASKATKGLDAKIPLILYNGAFIMDNCTQDILVSNFFQHEEVEKIKNVLEQYHIHPLVYAFIDQKEKFTYDRRYLTKGMKDFVRSRRDHRRHPLNDERGLYDGDVFYFTCIDEKEKLQKAYEELKQLFHCILSIDIYSQEPWLEILPVAASKSHAIQQLKDYLKCDQVIVFGDGTNDIDMFDIADECYAVENAVDALKEKATAIIGHHNDDAVAKWLVENNKRE